MEINYRQVEREELPRLREIDRREEIGGIYRLEGGELVLEKTSIRIEGWWEEELLSYIARLEAIASQEGFIYGAFREDQLVGLVALDSKFMDFNYLNLDKLYISRDYRGLGLGRRLMEAALEEAEKRGADYLYISASNFQNTIDFYLHLGARISSYLDRELFAKEPEDIHLELKVR